MEQMTKKWKLKWIYKSLLLCLADILIVMGSYFMALFMRFDFRITMIPEENTLQATSGQCHFGLYLLL